MSLYNVWHGLVYITVHIAIQRWALIEPLIILFISWIGAQMGHNKAELP